jgi:hypothetical protein
MSEEKDARKAATAYRLMEWSKIISDRVKSRASSVELYCETRGIARHQYYYWQRKLREAACRTLMQPPAETQEATAAQILTELAVQSPNAAKNNNNSNNRPTPSGWTLCTVAGAPTQGQDSTEIIIEIGSARIKVGEVVNPSQLEKICRVLTSLC